MYMHGEATSVASSPVWPWVELSATGGPSLWLGGCRAMAVGGGSVCGPSRFSLGDEVVTASEGWNRTASREPY